MHTFDLTKWYLDLVTGDGTAIIGYWARLSWGPLHLWYASVLRSVPGHPAEESTTVCWTDAPVLQDDGTVLHWQNDALGLTGEWRRASSPIDATLVDGADGRVHWSCAMPRADATVEWRGTTTRGLGYAEALHLTVPPQRLPMRGLRWGRYGSARHAAVWIEWEGPEPRRWTWLDGESRPEARVSATGVDLGADLVLRLATPRELRSRSVAAVVTSALPMLEGHLGPISAMQEHKQLSRATLVSGERGELDSGWAIHEEVTW